MLYLFPTNAVFVSNDAGQASAASGGVLILLFIFVGFSIFRDVQRADITHFVRTSRRQTPDQKREMTSSRPQQPAELGNLLAVVSISSGAPASRDARAQPPSNSTSTIFATNAISHPNFFEIVQAVAYVVHASLECADQKA